MGEAAERVVFDCVVFAQALISDKGPSAACLELARKGEVILVCSVYVFQEVRELPGKLTKYAVTPERVDAFLREVATYCEFIDPVPHVYVNPLDPDDSPYIDLAVAGQATLVTSWNEDFRSLMDKNTPAGRDFQSRFPNLLIVSPVQLLDRVRRSRHGG